jgi:L-serine dehydratase
MANLFEILGPTMVGPSSSHTAGACRLGLVTRAILGSTPERACIELHGSFAMTGDGHGTKRAILGGLLGFQPDDTRLRDSLEHVEGEGLVYEFRSVDLGESVHPNTVRIEVERDGETLELAGSSIGGGRIEIFELDGFPVSLTGSLPTLVVLADDVPGTIAEIASMFVERQLNLATVRVDRTGRGERALIMIEVDDRIPSELVEGLRERPWVHWIRRVQKLD